MYVKYFLYVCIINLKQKKMKLFRTDGSILYEDKDCETTKELVEAAIKTGIRDFGHVNLCNEFLDNIDFSNINLSYANFKGAHLSNSNFSGANLYSANFNDAVLYFTVFSDANLGAANFKGVNAFGAVFKTTVFPIHCKWNVTYTEKETINIGCKTKTIKEWDIWFKGTETFDTPRDTPEFKQIYANYLAMRTFLKTLYNLEID